MLRKLACVAAVSSALWLSAAAALGLGDIDVKSRLHQKFSASVPLTAMSPEEAETLIVNLASNEDFARAGVERSEFVSTLKFEVKTDGEPRIEITSKQIAREPTISLLIDVRGVRNRLLREYTILLDPPDAPAPKPAAPSTSTQFYETPGETTRPPAPAAATVPAPAEAVPEPATAPPPSEAPAAEPAVAAEGGTYGPIQPKETLWSVATRLRAHSSVTMDQVMLAIFTGNPKAFDGGINGLRKGSVLTVPSLDEQQAVSPATAKARVAELRGMRPATPVPAPAAPTYSPPPQPAPAPVAPEPPKPAAKPPVPVAPAPALVEKKPQPTPPPAVAPAPPVPTPAPAPVETPPPAAVSPPPPPAEPVAPAPAEPAPVETPVETAPPAAVVPPPPVVVEEPDSGSGLPLGLILAVLLLLLAVGGSGLWYYRKRKQASEDEPATTHEAPLLDDGPAPKVVATAAAGSQRSVMDELEKLESSLAPEPLDLGAAAPASVPAPAKQASRMESTLAMTAQIPSRSAAPPPTMVDPTATAVIEASAASTARLPDKVDFDVTGQFESDTVSINLDTNDPVAEADFHLAYGLYDEAALLLIQAAEKDPGNTAVRVKLAEVYFAAGKPAEFQKTAEGLKNQLPAGEWQKLAILGQQLCPDAAIFMDAGGGGLDAAVDLNFDEPAAGASPQALDLPAMAEPAPAAVAAMGGDAPGGGVLDFKLEDFQLPSAPAAPAPKAAAPAAEANSLEFNLDVPAINVPPAVEPKLELDLASFDLEPASPPPPPPKPAAAAPKADLDAGLELRLEDFDVAADSANLASGDAAGTKLDLARAYMDMDKDMARTLLEEVIQQGNAEQKQEAQALMGRIS